MAILRTLVPDIYLSRLALLKEVVKDAWTTHPTVHDKLFQIKSITEPFINVTGVSGFGEVPTVAEGEPVSYDDPIQGYDKKFTPVKYGMGYKISDEAMSDDLDSVFADGARQLGLSWAHSLEVVTANVFNNGFSSSYTGPDGKELFATDHPLTGGGTEQNELTNSADLSVTSLEQALVDFKDTLDNRGKRIRLVPKILLVPYELKFTAAQLVENTEQYDTANRAINAFRDEGLRYVTWEYLTDSDAWFLLSVPADNPLRLIWRQRPDVTSDKDFDSGMTKVKIVARLIEGWADFRGAYGSPGG